jgi:hypothetical protein
MLYKMGRGQNRLFRHGDDYHPDRADYPYKPSRTGLPTRYHDLLEWYENSYEQQQEDGPWKVFGPDAALLHMEPFSSGLRDVAEHHDDYLVRAWIEEHQRRRP